MKICLVIILLCLVNAKLPTNFEFGVSTAAYQIEGAWLDDNKSLSVWDNFVHSGMVVDNSTGDVADDSYNKYHQDISIMKEYGIRNYRMSVAWSRIIPKGYKGSEPNMIAIEHYRKQFKALLNAGITPFVTLYHNVMPAILYINGTGYTDPDFIEDFTYYADVCFKHFGDLVKYWFTFNEPWVQAVTHSTDPEDASTKPYLITHSILRTHAKVVKLYRETYKPIQKGKIGIVLNTEAYYPKDPKKPSDVEAAQRALIFQLNWYAEPLFSGEYPEMMKKIVKERLPEFTPEEKKMLINSMDFYAFNSYFPLVAEPGDGSGNSFEHDRNTKLSRDPKWKPTDMDWGVYPKGFYDILMYTHTKWLIKTDLEVYIAESGIAVREPNVTVALKDWDRIDYIQSYMDAMVQAIEKGVKVTKYFVWSLLDNFEWGSGLSKKFGLVRIEYDKDQQRIPKKSIEWYSEFIKEFA